MNRRELLRGLALGGAVIAGELWIPGKRVISIPKPIDYASLGRQYAKALADSLVSSSRFYLATDVARDPDRFVWQKVWMENGQLHRRVITDIEIYERDPALIASTMIENLFPEQQEPHGNNNQDRQGSDPG